MQPSKKEKSRRRLAPSRRLHPLVLGVVILIAGLLLDRWWWQIGAMLLVAIFAEAYYHYRTTN